MHSFSDISLSTLARSCRNSVLAGLQITPYTETRHKPKLDVPIFDTHQLVLGVGNDLLWDCSTGQ